MALIGNKVAERDLRRWLDGAGYYGRSARVATLDLVAVARPGWVQIFRFDAEAKRADSDEWVALRGLLRDDDRTGHEVRLYEDDVTLAAGLESWSEGMIVTRAARRRTADGDPAALPVAAVGFAVAIAALVGIVTAFAR